MGTWMVHFDFGITVNDRGWNEWEALEVLWNQEAWTGMRDEFENSGVERVVVGLQSNGDFPSWQRPGEKEGQLLFLHC